MILLTQPVFQPGVSVAEPLGELAHPVIPTPTIPTKSNPARRRVAHRPILSHLLVLSFEDAHSLHISAAFCGGAGGLLATQLDGALAHQLREPRALRLGRGGGRFTSIICLPFLAMIHSLRRLAAVYRGFPHSPQNLTFVANSVLQPQHLSLASSVPHGGQKRPPGALVAAHFGQALAPPWVGVDPETLIPVMA